MLGLDPSISGRKGLLRPPVMRFSGLRYASPENDGEDFPPYPPAGRVIENRLVTSA